MQSPGLMSANGDFIWFDRANSVTVTFNVAHKGRRRGAPATRGPSSWETVPLTFDSSFNRLLDMSSPVTSFPLPKRTQSEPDRLQAYGSS